MRTKRVYENNFISDVSSHPRYFQSIVNHYEPNYLSSVSSFVYIKTDFYAIQYNIMQFRIMWH